MKAIPEADALDGSTSYTEAPVTMRDRAIHWWRAWDHKSIHDIGAEVPLSSLITHPEIAFWRALAAFMNESADALDFLDLAWRGHEARGDTNSCAVSAHTALVVCLLDSGAMNRVGDWQIRADANPLPSPSDDLHGLLLRLGAVARVALGAPTTSAADLAAEWLHAQLRSMHSPLSADERLLAALVLIEYHFAAQRFEQFDLLACLVEVPAQFDAACPLLRARWLHMHAFAHYQAGNHERAETTWQRALETAALGAIASVQLQTSLALVRLLLDRGRVDEAHTIVEAVRPQWGAGRTAQLIQLQQMRGRVQLLRGQPVRALATLQDALRLADAAALSASEQASCHTDLAQAYIALDRIDEAFELLERLAGEHSGRDAQVTACLHGLLRAWRLRDEQPAASRAELSEALAGAQHSRYSMFFRLLPALAASVCALALRWRIEPQFVEQVIRERALPAPADADRYWPWPLWLGMFGGFELTHDGVVRRSSGKTQHKPLELLRLLACERTQALACGVAIRALWPEADDSAGQRNLDMAVLRLRRLLGDASLLWVRDGRVGLDASRTNSDLRQRRTLIERIEALAMQPQGEAGESAAHHNECLMTVERVIALSRGELLPGVPPAAWLDAERQHCRQDLVRAALAAVAVLERAPVASAERELLEAALRIEPLAEALVHRLMQAYQRAGQRGDALRVFEAYRREVGTRGATPGAKVSRLWQDLLARG